jgi:hypothetical protein
MGVSYVGFAVYGAILAQAAPVIQIYQRIDKKKALFALVM